MWADCRAKLALDATPRKKPWGRANDMRCFWMPLAHLVTVSHKGECHTSRHSGHVPQSPQTDLTPLSATASSGFCCLSVSANMFFFWYSKPSYSAPVAIELLNLLIHIFLTKWVPLTSTSRKLCCLKLFLFFFFGSIASFSSLQPVGLIGNVHLKSSDQGRKLKWLINQRCKKHLCIACTKNREKSLHQPCFINT